MSRRRKIAFLLILAFAIAACGGAVMTVYQLLSPKITPEGHRPISSLRRDSAPSRVAVEESVPP